MSSTQVFGRLWRLQVLTPPNANQQQTLLDISNQDDQTKEMRLTFEVQTFMSPRVSALSSHP